MSNHKLAYLRVIPSSPSSAAAKSQQCYFIFVKLHSFLKILYVALKCVTSQENKRVVVRGGLYYVRWRGSSACAGVWLWFINNSQNCSSVDEGLWFDAKAVVKDSQWRTHWRLSYLYSSSQRLTSFVRSVFQKHVPLVQNYWLRPV